MTEPGGRSSVVSSGPDRARDLDTALAVVATSLVETLRSWEPQVRADAEGSVHQMRVSARTLRSVLTVYRPLLEKDVTRDVRRILRDLGRLLSAARDAEVVRGQVSERVSALPDGPHGPAADLVPDAVAARLRAASAGEYADAHATLVSAMDDPGYTEQLDRVEAFARRLPLRAGLSQDQRQDPAATLAALADTQADAILELARRARDEEDTETRIHLLHEVRKSAKLLRYAVKAVQDAAGLDLGAGLAGRMKAATKLQDALGVHRDSIMFQEHILETAARARDDGADTFGYGLLYAAETATQETALAKASRRLRKLERAG